jgi:hypothetical protein
VNTLPPVGSIGLVSVRGFTGWLIRLGQWVDGDGTRNYEHAFVLVAGDEPESARVVEAEPGGVVEVPLSRYRGRKVLWLRCPREYSDPVATAALAYIGFEYSIEDYFAIAAQRMDITPIAAALRQSVDHRGHVMCSQMAYAAAVRGGWLRCRLWPGYVTPARLAELAPADARPRLIE